MCSATPTPPILGNRAAVSLTVPFRWGSVIFPGADRPVTYTTAPASARIVDIPLPMPRLAPVTMATDPTKCFASAEPMTRVALTQGSPLSLAVATPVAPGMQLAVRRSTGLGGTRASGCGRRQAQVARATASPRRSPAWRNSSSASRAAHRPSAASPRSWRAPAAAFNAEAWPGRSPSSLKSAAPSSAAFSAPSPSRRQSCTSASVCRAAASPRLAPALRCSSAASCAFARAPCASPCVSSAWAASAWASARPAASPRPSASASNCVAARSACSPAETIKKALVTVCSTEASVFLSSANLDASNASFTDRMAISGCPLLK
mmetsp:Transcript_41558/g.115602  ORF Transcript_41558/g.115602 Transcript_41558/m.115602 type:complete len:320 (-) Transcript_41558:195-1154(-)